MKPDPAPDTTESGFIIPGTTHIPSMSGRVVAVGDGPARLARTRDAVIARCMAIVTEVDNEYADGSSAVAQIARDELRRFRNAATSVEHIVNVGDRVLFAPESGHDIVVNERTKDRVLILAEDDILAVVA